MLTISNMKNKSLERRSNKILGSIIVLFFFLISIGKGYSQFNPTKEIGIIGGVSYYTGDLNEVHFNNSKIAGGISFRQNFDRRFSFKSCMIYSAISGDDRESSDQININRNLHFKTNIVELSGQIEFNFLSYETGNPLYNFSPFVFAGISLFNYNPKAESNAGEWIELQPLGTEGQGTTAFPNRKKYALTQLSFPFGGGIKFSLNESINVVLEYGLRKTFTDYIDDVSTTYAGTPSEFNPLTIELADRSLDGPKQAGEARGVSTNNDWYSFTGITLSFKLRNNIKGCDY